MSVLILAAAAVMVVAVAVAVIILVVHYLSKPAKPRASLSAQPFASPALSHQDVLRTRYFVNPVNASRKCPRCHAALAADAPEGLCPACLMAGGLEGNSLPPTSSGHGTPSGIGAVDAAALAEAFPNLDILELLGQGGMGTVIKVRQKNIDRMAALKVIPPQAALDPTFAERFAREARALARLNHSSIVTVYDSGQQGGFYFLLMEYIDGANLRQLMRSERIAPREALAIVPQICDALQYAHDQGIVHRDIKPENVLIDRTGRVKIADFGLAKLLGTSPADFTLTHTQQVMGTPRYMAPEQIERPSEVDHRADIYSLGVVIYEMLTGELPMGRFAPPSQKVEIDVRLDAIVLRTLEKEPARRYQRASEVRTELESVGHSAPPRRAPAGSAAAQHRAIEQALSLKQQAAAPPLGIVLAVAIGMVLGMLMIGAGLALAAFPFFASSSWNLDPWPFFGAGIGTLVGGAGAFLGSYNTYRQLAGAVDLMSSPDITWFDYVLLAYGALGILTMIPGIQGMLFDPSEEHVYPMLLMGGIVSFQALLGILWRWGARNLRAGESTSHALTDLKQRNKLRPDFVPAVVVPALAIAAVWGLVLLNFHSMTDHWPKKSDHHMDLVRAMPPSSTDAASGGVTVVKRVVYGVGRDHRGPAIRSLWIAAAVSVALVFCGLTIWRGVGPRRAVGGPPAVLAVAPPFGHPIWPLGVAVLSLATLVFPWVSLKLDDVVREPDFQVKLTNDVEYSGESLRQITAMPEGVRHIAAGVNHVGGVAAAILAIAGTVLAVSAMARRDLTRTFAVAAIVAGILAILFISSFGHRIGERDETLVIDAITLRGLGQSISIDGRGPGHGSAPALVLAEYVSASPAFGMYTAAAAAGLLVLIGATQWAWSLGASDDELAAVQKPVPAAAFGKPEIAGDRELALALVRAPGMGLIVSGVLGLAPIVLFCLAIPLSWAVERTGAATVIPLPLASIGVLNPPVLLAQAGPPMGGPDLTMWGLLAVTLGAVVLLAALPSSILLILGGLKMRQLHSYGLARFAAIVALLPLGPQWLVSLPMGIWALAVLGRPEVKRAFE
ncbi:MAG TPA: serine/threonine-protein kinase [Pirellulaceae bacterium]|nr:serine/threonine-protein kinase [Pirellulaceae bacterium]